MKSSGKSKGFIFQIKENSLFKRLSILSASARYDNSCSGVGREREFYPYSGGNNYLGGISYVWTSNGRCVPLLKILMTNFCYNNCKYCVNRAQNDLPRAILTPREIADTTLELYKKNYIRGLFLSSGIYRDPNYTMEIMLESARILRNKYYFDGYIHLKLIPGASRELVEEAFRLADRVSSNLELPTETSLRKLAPEKRLSELIKPLTVVREIYEERDFKAPASTQVIVGATQDTDKTILSLANELYHEKMVRRVYYSAYIPVNKDKDLPEIKEPPFLREHRLYQADWLLRFYGFGLNEIFEDEDFLPLEVDPKLAWALRHLEFFPVELTRADYYEIIRVPGIGPTSARKIMEARKHGALSEETLRKLRIPLKRARYFITIRGRPLARLSRKEERALEERQLSLFDDEKNPSFPNLEI
ncbi:MAG: putative DNA modification/repair radical SAM protein [Synergistetes bacterium]|nr:putative DNA modification/repair radical SAM protein [Synergistota bacterium]